MNKKERFTFSQEEIDCDKNCRFPKSGFYIGPSGIERVLCDTCRDISWHIKQGKIFPLKERRWVNSVYDEKKHTNNFCNL
jgi:hypothetical protein